MAWCTNYADHCILYIKMQRAITGRCKYIRAMTLGRSIAIKAATQLTEIWNSCNTLSLL